MVDTVDEAQLEGGVRGPVLPAEHGRLLAHQPRAAARLHMLDEDLVDVAQVPLDDPHVRFLDGLEGVVDGLVVPGGVGPAVHPQLIDELVAAEPHHDHTNAAHDGAPRRVDLGAGAGQPVAARGRHVLHEDDDGNVGLLRLPLDVGADEVGLHGRAAGGVDAEHNRLQVLGLEGEVNLLLHGDHVDVAPLKVGLATVRHDGPMKIYN